MNELNAKIRKVRLQIVDNLTSDFTPIDEQLDSQLEKELSSLLKDRKKTQTHQIDTLSNMYLRIYA